MANMRAVFKIIKHFLLSVSLVIGIATLPTAGVITFLLSHRGNQWLRHNLETYLAQKLQTRVRIGGIHFRTIYHLTITDFNLLDRAGGKLLSFESLLIQLQWGYWWKSHPAFLSDLQLDGLARKMERASGSKEFNFQFLPDAFATSNKQADEDTGDIA